MWTGGGSVLTARMLSQSVCGADSFDSDGDVLMVKPSNSWRTRLSGGGLNMAPSKSRLR